MRFSFVAPLVLVGGIQAAQASFDLMYIPSPSANRVIRYDPVNRIQLGSFHAPGASAVYSGNAQMGAIQMNGGIYRYNMYTNTNMGFLAVTPVQSYDPSANGLMTGLPSGYLQRDINTNASGSFTLTGATAIFRANTVAPGFIGAFQNVGGTLSFRYHNSTTAALVASTNFSGIFNFSRVSNMIVTTNRSGHRVSSIAGYDPSLGWRLAQATVIGSSVFVNTTGFGGMSTAHSVALAPAHAGFYVVGADSASPGTLTRFLAYDDDSSGFQYDFWTESMVSASLDPNYSVGMVVAPEPGTMAALGLGLVALLRRRRASTSR